MLLTLLFWIVLGILIFNWATGTFHIASWLALLCAIILAPCISFLLTIISNVLFVIFAGIFGFIGNICSYMRKVWMFLIGYTIFIFIFIFCGLSLEAISMFLIGLLSVLFIPCIIRYGFKKRLLRKPAVIITAAQGIVLYLFFSMSSSAFPSMISIGDIVMIFVPYYIMSDDPLIPKKTESEHYQREDKNVDTSDI